MENMLRIFIGSSSEAVKIDLKIRSIIERLGVKVIGWREVFKPGDYLPERLHELSNSIHGALLIVSPDDLHKHRGKNRWSPRDNILLELGFFLSQFGRFRTGIIHVFSQGRQNPELPTDLNGITTIRFDPSRENASEPTIKDWLDNIRLYASRDQIGISEINQLLLENLCGIPYKWYPHIQHYIIEPISESISNAVKGRIILTPGQYYQALYNEMNLATNDTIIRAVATMTSSFWSEDLDQQHYLKKNLDATKHGADIRRLFIVPDNQIRDLSPIITQQIEGGIEIRIARPRILMGDNSLEDMVIFTNSTFDESRAYIAEPAIDNPRRIRRGRMILDTIECNRLIKVFERVWYSAPEAYQIIKTILDETKTRHVEPYLQLKKHLLDKPVITCNEAAETKGIPLKNELKSILISSPKGLYLLHLPGDSEASLRALKKFLETDEACLASPEQLKSLGLSPGTVCAIKNPCWSMPHLISRRLLELSFISTNDGTLKGFYIFDPSVLLEAVSASIGDFEK